MTDTPASVELKRLHKSFGQVSVVNDLSLRIEPGHFVSFLGPSGCGKTTTLRLIAGFIAPSAGQILVRGNPVDQLPPYQRDMGMVFQNYALFPHLTVAGNIAFGLEVRGWDRQRTKKAVQDALALVQLSGVENRLPRELSGGQQQRVALARALVIQPSVLLLDEPLSNLDAKLRQEMRAEIRALQKRVGITTIFVTHDQEEALAMSDQVVVVNQGRIEQTGSPREIYERPATPFVARFMGNTNLIEVTVVKVEDGIAWVRPDGETRFRCQAPPAATVGSLAQAAIRPERIRLCAAGKSGAMPGYVLTATYQGHSSLYEVAVGDATLKVLSDRHDLAPGDGVGLEIDAEDAQLMLTPQRQEATA